MLGRRLYSSSSKKWLSRQSNDIFVKDARAQQYRARSAFKLLQLNDKHRFLKGNSNIIELGASPGGWTQVIAEKVFKGHNKLSPEGVSSASGNGTVIAVDLLPMDPIPGVHILQGDFLEDETRQHILQILDGKGVDAVLSDMAPSFSGHHLADHARSMVRASHEGVVFRNGAHSHLPGTLRIRFGFCHKYLEKGWRLYLQGELNTYHTLGRKRYQHCTVLHGRG